MSAKQEVATPEIATRLRIGDSEINYHDTGDGQPVLLIHGSGPGVTAWANWRGVIPVLSKERRVVAPDMLGFGYTASPPGLHLDGDVWVNQLIRLLDELGIESTDVVGNSFGGAIALALTKRYPKRVRRVALMGAVGLSFPLTEGLDAVWGYRPSLEAMRELLKVFVHNQGIINDDLVAMRYAASIRADVQARFEKLFPAPRQAGIEMLALGEDALRAIEHQILVIHGRNDRVIPLEVSERMARLLPNADLHVYANCGHWVQIERADEFAQLVRDFLART